MNRKQFDFFKDILKQRLDEHMNNADHTISELVSQRYKESDSIDNALADTDHSLKLRFRSRESLLIRKIQQALDRIENHSYGICESCGEYISLKRLTARPVTNKCIDCKEEEERQELLMQHTID